MSVAFVEAMELYTNADVLKFLKAIVTVMAPSSTPLAYVAAHVQLTRMQTAFVMMSMIVWVIMMFVEFVMAQAFLLVIATAKATCSTSVAFVTVQARFTSAAVQTSLKVTATAMATSLTLLACVAVHVQLTRMQTASAMM